MHFIVWIFQEFVYFHLKCQWFLIDFLNLHFIDMILCVCASLLFHYFFFQFNDYVIFFYWCILAIIGIVGCADALKATSLIFGRSNQNKTTGSTTTTTTTTSTTVASIDGEQPIDVEVSVHRFKLNFFLSSLHHSYLVWSICLSIDLTFVTYFVDT